MEVVLEPQGYGSEGAEKLFIISKERAMARIGALSGDSACGDGTFVITGLWQPSVHSDVAF